MDEILKRVQDDNQSQDDGLIRNNAISEIAIIFRLLIIPQLARGGIRANY